VIAALSRYLLCYFTDETRYTAVTTDPDGFPTSGLRLRQNSFDPPRQTELFIVITMYNENAELFCRTLYGVMKNIAHLCGRKNSRVWGRDGWQKVSSSRKLDKLHGHTEFCLRVL